MKRLLSCEGVFGAVSSETQIIRGQWVHEGQTYFDDLLRVFLDVPDSPDSTEFFRAYKQTLKGRFRQIDIWMVTFPVEII